MHAARFIAIALLALILGLDATVVKAQSIGADQASAFLGTWLFEMTEPDELKGTTETIRVWDKNGQIAASVQVGKFPANDVAGLLRDGDLLILSTTLRENGRPIWVVISLKHEGETMKLAQMMELSKTVRGPVASGSLTTEPFGPRETSRFGIGAAGSQRLGQADESLKTPAIGALPCVRRAHKFDWGKHETNQ